MSKKKPKNAAGQENPEQVDSQAQNGDVVPPTIVEATEGEVFPKQEETQEGVTGQSEEKPAPKTRVSKRPYIADLEILLAAGTHTKKTMLEFIKEKYPSVNMGGAGTFITDLCNSRYNHFKPRAVVKLADGRLQFADMVPSEPQKEAPEPETPEPEVGPEAEPTEEPGE